MRETDVQQLDTELPRLQSKTPGEGSECVGEPGRALQLTLMQRFRRHERIRLLVLGMGLLVIMLSIVFFVFRGTIVPLFATIVVVPLFYWCVGLPQAIRNFYTCHLAAAGARDQGSGSVPTGYS